MRLPPLSILILIQAVLWCGVGVWAHGWPIMLYPLAWGVFAAMMFTHLRLKPIPSGAKVELPGNSDV